MRLHSTRHTAWRFLFVFFLCFVVVFWVEIWGRRASNSGSTVLELGEGDGRSEVERHREVECYGLLC